MLQRFFLLSHVVAAPLIALGVVMLVRFAANAEGPIRIRLLSAAVGIGVLAAIVLPAARGYQAINQRDNHIAGRYAQNLIDTVAPG